MANVRGVAIVAIAIVSAAAVAIAQCGTPVTTLDFVAPLEEMSEVAIQVESSGFLVELEAPYDFDKVPSDLPWQPQQLLMAEAAIESNTLRLNRAFDILRASGASTVAISATGPLQAPLEQFATYPAYRDLPYLQTLVGFDESGLEVAETIAYDGPQFGPLVLFQLPAGECSLVERALLNPLTWLLPNYCSYEKPSARDYLRASLITDLFANQSPYFKFADVWKDLQAELASKADFHVTDSRLVFERSDAGIASSVIPLTGVRGGTSYSISLPQQKQAPVVFHQSEPTLAARLQGASLVNYEGFERVAFFGG